MCIRDRSNRDNLAVENFGAMWNDTVYYPKGSDFKGGSAQDDNTVPDPGLKPTGHQTISFKPLCGLLNQPLYLPLCFSSNGLALEFELVSSGSDAVIGQNTNPTHAAMDATFFNELNTSTDWTISDFHVVGDVITLDSACLLYTSPSPRDRTRSRMPSSA